MAGMSDPTAMPFQEDEQHGTAPEDSIYEGERPDPGPADADTVAGPTGDPQTGAPEAAEPVPGTPPDASLETPAQTETDRLAASVTGPEDQVGMTALWRLTMGLEHWWFIAVGEEGLESPAAATIQDQLMLLTFTNAERARHFAVQNGMVAPTDDMRAIALPPREVVESAQTYSDAGIGGLMFDAHLAGYFIPSDQLPVVWDAVQATAAGVEPVGD